MPFLVTAVKQEKNHMRKIIISTLSLLILGSVAVAKPSLWSYERIDTGLFQIGIAWGVKENCSVLKEHRLNGITFSLGLYNYAKSQGYSHDEVRDFLDSDAEKEKLRARVTTYFKNQGLNPDTQNALCQYGETQIANGTQVGRLLRKSN